MPDVWPPDYAATYTERSRRLLKLRANPALWAGAKEYYRTRPVEFIEDWCITDDPRNIGTPIPVRMPFVLFKRQRQLVEFLHALLTAQEKGLVEKARTMGATWICCAFSVWVWLFHAGAAIGWGSRKEELVDGLGDPKNIFEKIRAILDMMPRELLPDGFARKSHTGYMKIINPENGASIAGEAGKNIGRGGRTSIYFLDEAAHLDHPEAVDAALSQNTRVEIDISSVSGLGNLFYRRRMAGSEWTPDQPVQKGRVNVFVMDWREHPAMSQDWYDEGERKAIDEGLLHVWRSEVDRDYSAAVVGIVIPGKWVAAAIDAHVRLGFDDGGGWIAGLDVADEGGDRNALALRKGSILKSLSEWGEGDTGATTRRAISACGEVAGYQSPVLLQYDAASVGAGVKGESNRLKEQKLLPPFIHIGPWMGGGAVLNPDGYVVEGDRQSPKNKDFYQNLKAQAWWMLRRRFEKTFRALNEPDFTWTPDELISLPSNLPKLRSLQQELSQPTASQSANMKLLIDKKPEGTKSPNLADAVVMAYWPVSRSPMLISDRMLELSRVPRR